MSYRKEKKQPLYPLCMTQQSMCFNVEDIKIQRNIKDNTEEEWEELVQIFRKNKR